MDIEKEYSCLERNSLAFHKLVNIDENYQETLESYLDDIFRVIKCTSRNVVTSCETIANEILITGKTIINLTYRNENKELIYTDFEEEFTKSISVDEFSENAFATSFVCNKCTSYRVINQRRIDVVSSFSIDVKLYDKASCPCVKSCNTSKLKMEKIKQIDVVGTAISKIEFDEELSVPTDSNGINRVVSITNNAILDEIRVIKDKFLVKGRMCCNLLYSNTNNEICRLEHTFEISKIVELGGIDESNEIIVRLDVGNTYAKAKGDGTSIEIFGDIYANTTVLKECDYSVVTDGYIVGRKTKIDYSSFEVCSNIMKLNEPVETKLDFEFSSAIKKIEELELCVTDAVVKSNRLFIKMSASILNNCENEIENHIANASFEYKLTNEHLLALALRINSFDYNIVSDNKICVRISLNICGYSYALKKINVMSELHCDDEKISFPALSLYFGKANESLWDIAKSFSSDIALIQKENNIKTEILDTNKVLIIPGL